MASTEKMLHIAMGKGDVAEYVFLPGDPGRSEKIAKYFDNPVMVAQNREYVTYSGTLEGVPVSVTSTGIGGPSAAIAMEELVMCGSHTFIRIGTCASVSPKVHVGTVSIPRGAVRMEGVGLHYLPIEFPPVPDFFLIKELEQAAIRLGMHCDMGITITKDSFYTQINPEDKPVGYDLVNRWEAYIKGGATTTSMESSPLFLIAGYLGVRMATVLVSATDCNQYSREDRKRYGTDWEENAILTGIEAMRSIVKKDQQK